MAFERAKILGGFTLLGFILGSLAYFLFEWIITGSSYVPVYLPSIPPWFLSGVVGALLTDIIVVVTAYSKKQQY